MTNAKEELQENLRCLSSVRCAEIFYSKDYVMKGVYRLQLGCTSEELDVFLSSLDFDYDSGGGELGIFGTVWLEDGSWLSRQVYDGSEWWEHRACPSIPSALHKSY